MQIDGITMDCPVSLINPDVFIKNFKEKALNTVSIYSRFRKQYVNASCSILPSDNHLNSLRPKIKLYYVSPDALVQKQILKMPCVIQRILKIRIQINIQMVALTIIVWSCPVWSIRTIAYNYDLSSNFRTVASSKRHAYFAVTATVKLVLAMLHFRGIIDSYLYYNHNNHYLYHLLPIF